MNKNAYRGHRFPPAIIRLTVWMYARFTLSLRDVEDVLAERGLDIPTNRAPLVPQVRSSAQAPVPLTLPSRSRAQNFG